MMRIIFLLFLFQIFSVSTVFASDNIVINEFLSHPSIGNDWVELYNPTGGAVDISGWVLDDAGTVTVMKTFPPESSILSHDFLLVYVSDRLGNSGDTITLKTSESAIENIDTIYYPYPNLGTPGINESMGRSPDGSDEWKIFFPSTPDDFNNPASPTPTTVPTATTTATPTAIPTPTPSLEPTETPTATVVPTSTPVPTVLPSPSATIHPTSTPINIHEILEKRMKCRFSYSRFARLPNGAMILDLLKSVFGQNSVCSS